MSRERARRRLERERDEAARRSAADRSRRRRVRRQARRDALAALVPARPRGQRQHGLLARRRRTQNGVIACLVLASQLVVWLISPDPWVRGTAAVLAVILTPVLVTLTLDRRP
ncbi:MAG: hypothetical protein QOI54_1329 [Actinomycetota bacterium]|nr:hypothetical protein [Actinomycetota bacterium]